VPTGYLWARRDRFFAPTAARRTEEFVTGPFTESELADAGHWLPETRPNEVAELVQEVASST
jgi:pimeloyl-ACP methyl ester carboxylesterase